MLAVFANCNNWSPRLGDDGLVGKEAKKRTQRAEGKYGCKDAKCDRIAKAVDRVAWINKQPVVRCCRMFGPKLGP